MSSPLDEAKVQVAVRVRPQSSTEVNEGFKRCTTVFRESSQIAIGADKLFTFDLVFDIGSSQQEIFDKSVAALVDGTLSGYNATILAYGQTGSGKTYTMGTSFLTGTDETCGIIPRAVTRLFDQIRNVRQKCVDNGSTPPDFKISAQFLELYNEEMNDLLLSEGKGHSVKGSIKIHGEGSMIYVSGASTKPVNNVEDCMKCLEVGSLNRVTASTNMNATSSRSHAIFTLTVKQQRILTSEVSAERDQTEQMDFETLTAKFHFVDLAGSERLKRTGATGDRAKEGIAINCGLLALGNVISALGDATKRASHVPYRNSKLTRLLQDSLGGNSRTMMIACVSPSDRDFMETLNTLVYANRAKNIKNKVTVNQDKASRQITDLKKRIADLESELLMYKQGKLTADVCFMNDMNDENRLLLKEQDNLREKIKTLQATIDSKTAEISALKSEREIEKLRNYSGGDQSPGAIDDLISQYLSEMESVKSKLTEVEIENAAYRKQLALVKSNGFSISRKTPEMEFTTCQSVNVDVESLEEDVSKVLAAAEADLTQKKETLLTSRSGHDRTSGRKKRRKSPPKSRAGSVSGDERSLAESVSEKSELRSSLDAEDSSCNEESDDEFGSENEEDESQSDTRVSNIAYITQEISVKEKLIEQLEKSQTALNSMRQGYDHKVAQLMETLKGMQVEKEKQMKNSDGSRKTGADVEKIEKEYKQRVSSLEKEIKKLRSFEKVNKKHMSELKRNEERIIALKNDVDKMRSDKAKLIRQMKEEGKKFRDKEHTQKKEVAQLKKQERVKDNKIKALEIENQQKNTVLQRKIQEIDLLRKRNKNDMSDKAAGVVSRSQSRGEKDKSRINRSNNSSAVNSSSTTDTQKMNGTRTRTGVSSWGNKISWDKFCSLLNDHVESSYSVAYLEREMEENLKERERWNSEKQTLAKKIISAKQIRDQRLVSRLEEELEVVKCSIEEIQERIEEKQTSILALNSSKESSKFAQLDVETLDARQSKVLLKDLIALSVDRSVQLRESEEKIRELEAQIGEAEVNKTIQQQLLDFVILDEDESGPNSLAPSPTPQEMLNRTFVKDAPDLVQMAAMSEQQNSTANITLHPNVNNRRRRRNDVPLNEMLYPKDELTVGNESQLSSETFVVSETPLMDKFGIQVMSAEELMTSEDALKVNSNLEVSRQSTGDLSSDSASMKRSNSFRIKRSEDSDVFKRLLKSVPRIDLGDTVGSVELGSINDYRGSIPGAIDFPLKCFHVAEGHKKGVVSIDATDDNLFSGSLDRTVKLWDLASGSEILSITGFPHSVLQVKYHTTRNLLFASSLHVIKVLDPLSKKSDIECIKVLKSSGGCYERFDHNTSQTTKIPQGEDQINDIAISSCGNLLYSVARNFIRVWDLRFLPEVVKSVHLIPSQTHKAAINVLAVKKRLDNDPDLIFTGSRDHCVKCCEAILETEGLCRNLEPPHFDGVESMCLYKDWLYTSGRDSCIKQWDVSSLETCQNIASVSSAHNHWITAMTIFPGSSGKRGREPFLVSGCRSGEIKVWDCDSLKQLGELKAHKAQVHAFASNSTSLFSASGDWDVKIWRLI